MSPLSSLGSLDGRENVRLRGCRYADELDGKCIDMNILREYALRI